MERVRLSEKFRKPPKFLTAEKYLREVDHPISSHPEARLPRIVPLVVFDYGSVTARIKQMRYVGKMLVESVVDMAQGAKSVKNNPYAGKTTIDAKTLRELEDYAYSLGASDIGYTKVNPRYIFNGFQILFANAMVFTIEMDKEKIKQAPSMPSFIEIFRTYRDVGRVVNLVADFLRERGYNAHAGPAIGGATLTVPNGAFKRVFC